MMCPHSCSWQKSTCRTCKNLLPLLRAICFSASSICWRSTLAGGMDRHHQQLHRREMAHTHAYAAAIRRMREPAGQSQYMEKKRKREENDQKQTGAQNSVRPFCCSQKTVFAQSFAQIETGSSLLHKNYFLPKALLR